MGQDGNILVTSMNERTAYAIAAALEKKCEEPVGLRSNYGIWEWHLGDKGYAVLKNTESPAKGIAQNAYAYIKPEPIKINKRRPDDE
jgi:hypothetical protein